jgi:hypothetical protein
LLVRFVAAMPMPVPSMHCDDDGSVDDDDDDDDCHQHMIVISTNQRLIDARGY